MLRQLAASLRDLVFPPICLACQALVEKPDEDFCSSCSAELTHDPHFTCPRCSSNVGEFADTSDGCPRCRSERYHFDATFRLGPYDGLLRDAVLRMKASTGETFAACFATLWARPMALRLKALGIEAVIPVPLHWWRRWQRGFNQSEFLAEAIALQLGVPSWPNGMKRIRATPSQTSLSATERRQNLRGAFRVTASECLADKVVLLVDDVLTTGSTASECAKTLRHAGVKQVYVAVVAHRG